MHFSNHSIALRDMQSLLFVGNYEIFISFLKFFHGLFHKNKLISLPKLMQETLQLYMLAFAVEIIETAFKKISKFGSYMKFPSISFLEENPLDRILCSTMNMVICLLITSSPI